MKKITLLLLTFQSLFSQESHSLVSIGEEKSISSTHIQETSSEALVKPEEKKASTGTLYLTINGDSSFEVSKESVGETNLSVGYRWEKSSYALDFSLEFPIKKEYHATVWGPYSSRSISFEGNYFFRLLKVNSYYYLSPMSKSSFYTGGGLAYGEVRVLDEETMKLIKNESAAELVLRGAQTETEFKGLIPNLSIGYEFGRQSKIKTFIQLDIAQPLIAFKSTGSLPVARGVLFLGIGY